MTRIDIAPQDREALKREIAQEIRGEALRKRLIGCGGCAVVLALLILIPTGYVAAQLAKTGFFDVPVLAKALYKPSFPSRAVQPLYGSTPEDVIRVIGTKAKANPVTGLVTVPATEAEITTIAQAAVAASAEGALPFPVRSMQVAIDAEAIELFAVSPQKNRDATVLLRFRPYVKGGELRADVSELSIGSLRVPKRAADMLFSAFGTAVTSSAGETLGRMGTPVNVETDAGIVRFILAPSGR